MFRKAFAITGALLALAVVGCKQQQSAPANSGGNTPANAPGNTAAEGNKAKAGGKRIAVVPKGMSYDFWLTVKAGADAAAKEQGAEVLWKGPAVETDIAGQIAILEDFINQKVDAIVMAACDSKGLVDTVKKAKAAGIPVITIDSGVDEDVAESFVATDNPKGAGEAAKALAQLVGDKGTVGVIPFIAGAATSQMREKGFKDELAKHPGMKVGKTLYSQGDVAKAVQACEDMLTDTSLVGIFAANEPSALGAAQALEQSGKAGKVKLVAFDASQPEIDALRKGSIQALVVQNPFQMGYKGVTAALQVLRGEKVEKRIDTGVTVVTKENMTQPEIAKLLNPLNK